jgi:hypothetical protein
VQLREVRQQVAAEQPAVALDGLRSKLALALLLKAIPVSNR